MPDDPIQSSATAPEPAEHSPAPSEESASRQEPTPSPSQTSDFDIESFIRGRAGGVPPADPTSKPDGTAATAESDEVPDGESTPDPSGDVKPSEARQPGRRGAAAKIAELEAENARLKRAYEEANPPPPDASEEARQAILAREQRFRDLNARPDDDPMLYEQGPDGEVNVNWLNEEKRRRKVAPELQQQYETVLANDLAEHRRQFDGWVEGFRQHTLSDLATAKDVPGVDFEAVMAAKTFAERDRLMWQAGNAQREAENRALRQENDQLKRDLLGTTPTPLNGGRSGGGAGFDIDSWIRQKAGVA